VFEENECEKALLMASSCHQACSTAVAAMLVGAARAILDIWPMRKIKAAGLSLHTTETEARKSKSKCGGRKYCAVYCKCMWRIA